MLKLKLQYFGHLIRRTDSLAKTLILGKIKCRRRSSWQKMRWLYTITDSMERKLPKIHMMYSFYKLNKQGDNIQP